VVEGTGMKKELLRLLEQQRGRYNKEWRSIVEKLDPQEAEALFRTMQYLEEDAVRRGERQGERKFITRGGFPR
jgi:hypothetical protein